MSSVAGPTCVLSFERGSREVVIFTSTDGMLQRLFPIHAIDGTSAGTTGCIWLTV